MLKRERGWRRPAATGVAVIAAMTMVLAMLAISSTASADPASDEWTMSAPFVESGQYAIPLVSADAGPSGTLLAFRRTHPDTVDGVRFGFARPDGSPVDWVDPLPGERVSFIRVAADPVTGDAAVLYWPYPEDFGWQGATAPLLMVTYAADTATWAAPRTVPVISSDWVGSEKQFVVSGGAAHLMWNAAQKVGPGTFQWLGLDVYRVPVAGGPVTTHALTRWSGTGGGPSLQAAGEGSASGILDNPHARLDRAPDGSLHAVWTHMRPKDSSLADPRDRVVSTYIARTDADATSWGEPGPLAPESDAAFRYVELLSGPDSLTLVEQSVVDIAPTEDDASWVTVTRASLLDAAGPSQPVEVSNEPSNVTGTNRTWVPTPDSRSSRAALSSLDDTRLLIADAGAVGGVRQVAIPSRFAVDTTFRPSVGFDRFDRVWAMGVCATPAGRCLDRWDADGQTWADEGSIALSFDVSPWSGDLIPSANDRGVMVAGHTAQPLQNLALYFPPGYVPPTSSAQPSPTESTATATATATPSLTQSPSESPEPTGQATASPTTSQSTGPAPTTPPTVPPSATDQPSATATPPPSSPSPTSTATPMLSAPPAPRPAVRSGVGSVRVTWTQRWTPGVHAVVTGYQLVLEIPSGATLIRHAPPSSRSQTFGGLRNGSRYVVAVRALSDAGASAWSASHAARPIARPAKPTKLRATTLSDGRTKLRWKAAKRSDAAPVAGYRVYVNGERVKTITSRATKQWTHRGEKKGKTYVYKVRAYNDLGVSTATKLVKKRR